MPVDPRKYNYREAHILARRCECGEWPDTRISKWYQYPELSTFCLGCVACRKVTWLWRRSLEDAQHDWNYDDTVDMSGRSFVWWYGAFVNDPGEDEEVRRLRELEEFGTLSVREFAGKWFIHQTALYTITNNPQWDPSPVWQKILEEDDQPREDVIRGFADHYRLEIVSPVRIHNLSIQGPEPDDPITVADLEETETGGIQDSSSAAE